MTLNKKKVLLITDTFQGNFNGVVNLINNLTQHFNQFNVEYQLYATENFASIPILPKELRLALPQKRKFKQIIDSFQPDHIHLFTEGTLGLSAKSICDQIKIPYTTSFNTQFDQYLNERYKFPIKWVQKYLNYFHKKSSNILVPTQGVKDSLLSYLSNPSIEVVGRGVNHDIFYCDNSCRPIDQENPMCVYVGRIVKEKNLDAFLNIKSIKHKLVIGDGPMRQYYANLYPDVSFTGFLPHNKIKEYLNQADIFVFPSKTDTFGQVLLEAMACGLPIAAYPENGPKDVVLHGITGFLSDNLELAIQKCKLLNRQDCINYSSQFTWENITQQFLSHLV